MLDIKFVRENLEETKKSLAKRSNFKFDLEKVLKLEEDKRVLLARVEMLRAEQNKVSKEKGNISRAKEIKKILKCRICNKIIDEKQPRITEKSGINVESYSHINCQYLSLKNSIWSFKNDTQSTKQHIFDYEKRVKDNEAEILKLEQAKDTIAKTYPAEIIIEEL